MDLTVTEKIIASHCRGGTMRRGEALAIRIDQTLTQDATGTMAYLQFETMGLDRVQTELSVSYVDHNTLQEDWKNMDDHRYLQSTAAKYGAWFSRAGNGICHQVHLERFGEPGKTLLGSDSHTPTGGGLGMFAIGAGGLDVAAAMGGGSFHLVMPRIIGVRLSGALSGAAAKDLILELLRRETVKGGVGSVYEYFGEGVKTLSVPQRATITNMGAELGATSSVFPSDETTRAFLADRGREAAWRELRADAGAVYDRIIDIDLAALKPLAARPHSPDAVCPIAEIAGKPVDQVIIGSCTNSSLEDLQAAAEIVRGKTVHRRVSAALAPGSRTTLMAADRAGILGELIRAGFRILESACGPCIGMGAAPKSRGVSLRTFNRNFKGRSGTADAEIYLVSAESAAAAAVSGCITDPSSFAIVRRDMGPFLRESLAADRDGMLIPPPGEEEGRGVIIERGPNIKPCPVSKPVEDHEVLPVLLKAGDNITTDDIMPAGAKVLPLRSNIPEISKFMFIQLDPGFWQRTQDAGTGIIVGGNNYGQGSSREHAALVPMYLGIRGIIAKSFARIHRANLINFGILPLVFKDPGDYDRVSQGDMLEFRGIHSFLENAGPLTVRNTTRGETYSLALEAEERDRNILRAGGLIPYTAGRGENP
jgi:aconitate hydratase